MSQTLSLHAGQVVLLDRVPVDAADVIEVRVTTTTVHRVSRQAYAQIEANAAAGVRGHSALGVLLQLHEGEQSRGVAVESTIVEHGTPPRGILVGGWDYTAERAADAAVPTPQSGGIRAWLQARRDAENRCRERAGFGPLTFSTRFTVDRHEGSVDELADLL